MLLNKILAYIPGSLFPAIFALLTTTIFTRYLTTDEFGLYSLLITFISLIVALFTQWLQQSINRYLPGENSLINIRAIKESIGVSLIFILLTITFISIILYAVYFNFSIRADYFLPSLFLIYGMVLFNISNSVLQAEFNAKKYSLFNTINSSLKLPLSLIIFYFFNLKAISLIIGASLAYLILIPFQLKSTSLKLPFNKNTIYKSMNNFKKFLSYGMPMIGWFLSAYLMNAGDRYVIQLFRGPDEVGIYSASYNLIQGSIGLISAPILLAAHPFLMQSWNKSDYDQTASWLGKIITWFIIIGIALSTILGIFSKDIAFIFLGESFRSGHNLMPIIFAGFICWQAGTYAHKPFEFKNQTRIMLTLSLISAILNTLLNLLFVPEFGYIAAAYTTLASYMFYATVTAFFGRKILKWSVNFKYIIIFLITNVLFYFLIEFILPYLNQVIVNYFICLIVSIAITILLFGSALFILTKKIFSKSM